MNGPVRQGMPGGIVQANNNMLAISNPPFMQNPAHLGQPPLGQTMGVPQNMIPSNPPMSMLSGAPLPTAVNQRYNMQQNPMPQHQPQRQPMLLRQGGQNPQLTSATGAPSAAHMQAQLQGMHFPGNNMMQQAQGPNNAVRRVQSQPQMNPLGGMPNTVGGMPMGLNPQTSMPAHLRQVQAAHQHQHQLRLQQQAIMQQTDLMVRQAPNQSMPPMARTASTQSSQVMSSLTQPSPIGSMSHPSGVQPAHHQNPFPNGGPIPSQHPPPQASSSPRPSQNHTPSMSMGTPGPSHTPINRARMTPDNSNMSFMSYPGSQFPGNNPARAPSNATSSAYPSFVPSSSTPPMPMQMDLSQPSPSGMMHSQGGTPNRSTFMATPAQQYELMNSNPAMDIYSPSFGMPPPSAVPPPRPPSHSTNPHQPQQQQQNSQQSLQQPQQPQQPQTHHQSPPSDQMNIHPQRPQSQPQQMMPGRPPSQTGTTRTPRTMQLPLPPSGLPGPLTATGRLPVTQQTQLTPGSAMLPIAPRPPLAMGGPPPSASSAQMAVDAPPSVAPIQRPPIPPTSMSPGLVRLLQFSGVLSGETKTKLQLSYWNDLVKDYFTPKAMMKLTLWKDNQRTEAKPFEIGVPILPRFFLVTTQSGVKSMTFSLDGARERNYAPGGQGHTVVECVSAIWTYKYTNGYTVTLRGPLTVHVIVTATVPPGNTQVPQYTLKFDDFQFDANTHDKYIALEAILGHRTIKSPEARNTPTPTPGPGQLHQQQMEEDKRWEEPRVWIDKASIPGEPVNAFGIPQATMRCLELAESVSSMADLIAYAGETNLGPLDALKRYAAKIRDSQSIGGQHPQTMTNMPLNNTNTTLSNSFPSYPGHSPSVTLYSSAPSSITNPQPPNPPSSINSPQNTSSSSTNSPEKQPKTIPQQQVQTPQSGPASSPAVSSGGTTNTPAMANTSLKRKQGDASSPTVGNSEHQPAKRPQKKRGRTGTTGAG